jgi:hypothetical protein
MLENINLSSDTNRATVVVANDADLDFCHQSVIYTVSSVYFNCTLISFVHMDLAVFNFSEKITCFAFYLVL